MEKTGEKWEFAYDADGLRTQRKRGTLIYNYVYSDGMLRQMTCGTNKLVFGYGVDGRPYAVQYNGTDYYYLLNLQGDVVGIVNASGTQVVTYIYDAWGNILSISGSMASTLGQLNPLRYRGYVYDSETGLYYLKSRYYNAEIGRFISPDNYPTTGQGLSGNNMFAYCGNNPVSREDESGEFWLSAVVGAVVNIVTTYIAAKATDQEYTLADAAVAAVSGAVNAIPGVGMYVSGLVTGAYTGVMAHENGASIAESIGCAFFAGIATTASIGNLANTLLDPLGVATTAAADLVFGTGYNLMSAGIYKAATMSKPAKEKELEKSEFPRQKKNQALANQRQSPLGFGY